MGKLNHPNRGACVLDIGLAYEVWDRLNGSSITIPDRWSKYMGATVFLALAAWLTFVQQPSLSPLTRVLLVGLLMVRVVVHLAPGRTRAPE